MIFDQYSRYRACSDFLRQAGFVLGDSVFDIGSGPECLLGQFMPDAEITYLDPLIPAGAGPRKIAGDVFLSELDGRYFDCVSAVDVLEHVPSVRRQAFLKRLAAMGKNTLVLGFPTSDSSEASLVDETIGRTYRATFGREYSWLEEHYRYGLPSLAATVKELEQLGWHCQVIGHGHTPWLTELLSFVICLWDVPCMRALVQEISEDFNRTLYPHDFRPPFYRQFVVASREPLPDLVAPTSSFDDKEADQAFRSLMEDAWQRYFSTSLKRMAAHDVLNSEYQHKLEEISAWGQASQAALVERDEQIGALGRKLEEVSAWGQASQAALVERDEQIRALGRKLEEVSAWGQASQAALVERDEQIGALGRKLEEVSAWGQASQAALVERDEQIGALGRKLEEVSAWGQASQAALVERDEQIGALGRKLEEVSAWGQAMQAALVKRDEQIGALNQKNEAMAAQALTKQAELEAERNATLAEIEIMKKSNSWRMTRPLRFIARSVRHGLMDEDRRRISKGLRRRYHRLPLPPLAKRFCSFVYYRLFDKPIPVMPNGSLQFAVFNEPTGPCSTAQTDKPDYLVWGIIDWHFRHQRPQQLAQGLAKTGRRVFYISSNLIDDVSNGFKVEPLNTEGTLFQVNLFAKRAPRIYFEAPDFETIVQLRGSIGEMLTWANSQQIVSLIEHPFWFEAASMLPNSRLVYDCMDHHEGFGNNAEPLMQIEREMLRQAELTVITSQWLDDAMAPHARNRALIRNAGDYAHFAHRPADIYRDPQGRRVIGYYGAIAEWFDIDLVEAVARQNPNCSVLLIGADTVSAKDHLAHLPNVTLTGEVPYARLPHYLHGFDVCLLPFKVIPLTLATNPVKAYEYLSAGKPVVAVDLPEMKQFDGLLYAAPDRDTFMAAVSFVLDQSEPAELVGLRQSFAAGQTWVHRCDALIREIETSIRDPWVSVIVVTYNNLDMTRACLHSLEQHSQYANCEVIVVDNASSDGTREFLLEWARANEHHQFILNDDNRGFAAANNQGLAIATGDYLVLLNNDTYVTPGWIRTLLGHLRRDPTIGLIGPVTNNIGNEARIEIHYANMNEMQTNASAYTRRHIGQLYPLRTAAFFCVMMPRATYETVGALDEAFGRGFFEDDDYCRRVEQQGLRIACAEDVFIHHHLSASFGKISSADRDALMQRNRALYEKKWGAWIPHSYRIF